MNQNPVSTSNPALTGAIRIVLADDHRLVRDGVRALLERMPGVQVVAEANDGREALDMVKQHRPDIVLMDIAMPNLNGLEAASRVVRDFPDTRVIILSMHQNEAYFWQALKAGAAGYVLKKAASSELKAAIQRVKEGEIYLSSELSQRMLKKGSLHHIAQQQSPVEKLSERQREVLQRIAEGQTTKAIALDLNVSPKTVEYHRAKLMEALGIYDIPRLVRFALQEGLVTEEG
jgi:DNA-binding NarL/FixJ family response regulator